MNLVAIRLVAALAAAAHVPSRPPVAWRKARCSSPRLTTDIDVDDGATVARVSEMLRTARARPPVTLPTELQSALAASGIRGLNALQEAALPPSIAGASVLVHAETGSGKTLCFGLPLAAGLINEGAKRRESNAALRGLVLSPTLELCAQTCAVLNGLLPGCASLPLFPAPDDAESPADLPPISLADGPLRRLRRPRRERRARVAVRARHAPRAAKNIDGADAP